MNEDVIIPWLLQRSAIWTALLAGLAPAMVANFKRRSIMPWYLYGFACTLVAWPLITLPTCVPSAAADYVARGPTTAAAGRRAGPARGKQRAIVPNVDSRTEAQIA